MSGNTVSSGLGEGGGIWVRSNFGGPGVLIWNDTITDNYPGGIYAEVQTPGADVAGSIIAGNRDNAAQADVDGLFTNSGLNLIGNIGTAGGLIGSISGDAIVQADPRLGPLGYNGGPTPTHALLPCSPAIDHGFNVSGFVTDQRGVGFGRTLGDRTDIGAYELQTFTPNVCNTGPPTIDAANAVVQQGTMGNCPTCPWFQIAEVSDPDGLFGLGISGVSGGPPAASNGVELFHIRMLSPGVFSAQIAASCTASDASFILVVHDGQFEAGDTLAVTVTPETTPPVIMVRTDPITPFPNDHKYRAFPIHAFISGASDNCDASVDIGSVIIEEVTSDEAENLPGRSDGDTLDDIVISADCRSVQLRAERDGNGDGRVYTITLRVRDAAGNTTRAVRKVAVPLSQNGNPAAEGPAQYTIRGNCT